MQEKVKGIFGKIKQWWKAAAKKTKLILGGGLLAVVVALIITAVVISGQPQYATLFTGLNQTDMTSIVSYLSDNGVTDYKISGDDTILVPVEQADALKADLLLQNYPKSGYNYSTYLDNVGSLTTEAERNTLYLYELQDRMANVVRQFDGVKDASVSIVQSEDHTYVLDSNNVVEATASVIVTMQDGKTLTDNQVTAIRNLVSHAVQGLTIENVVIEDTFGNRYDDTTGLGQIQDASDLKLKLEQQWNNTIRTSVMDVLVPLYNPENVRVSVNTVVDVDRTYTDSTNYSTEDWAADGSTNGEGIIGKKVWDNSLIRGDEETAGGVVGAQPNADLNTYVENEMNPDGTEQMVGASGQNEYLVDQENRQVEHLAGYISDVMVSVTINQNVAGATRPEDLYAHVARAAGISQEDQWNKISILVAPFYQEDTTPALPTPENLPQWVLYAAIGGGVLFLLLLLLIIALVHRHRVKKRRKQMELEALAAQQQQEGVVVQEAPPEQGANIMDMQTEKSMELRKDVRKFAEENPEIAAQMVKNWLKEGDGTT